ncbi:MAG: hypothetical protein M3Y07_15095, partial [Acidobacteriota bacterium]|nr:hypothetical protein [Acidobacteriota bacterium]
TMHRGRWRLPGVRRERLIFVCGSADPDHCTATDTGGLETPFRAITSGTLPPATLDGTCTFT